MNNKINLVTGGTGFLGSHLTKYLLDAGEQVISLDNNFTGSKKNIKEFLSHPNFLHRIFYAESWSRSCSLDIPM